jgi:KDO2-lipid IV(A) lauroyltransferase
VLSLKTGASLIPVYMIRNPNKTFECHIFPALAYVPTGQRERDIQTIMQKLMDTLQSVVQSRPDQWYMFRDMWPEDAGAQSAGARETAVGRQPV